METERVIVVQLNGTDAHLQYNRPSHKAVGAKSRENRRAATS
jgi:hypothetical protein